MPKTRRSNRKFYNKKREAMRSRTGKKRNQVKISAPLRRAIKAVAKSQMETKYRAEYIDQNLGVTAGTVVPAGLRRLMPSLAQGNGDSDRIGDRILPTRAKASVTVHFQATPSGGAGAFSDVDVHIIFLAVKGAKTAATVAQTPAGTLLKNGAGGNFDPAVGSVSQTIFLESVNQCPVNTDQFIVLSRQTRRFAKGDYDINGPAGPTTSGPPKCNLSPKHTFTYNWKPPTLDYNSSLDTFPTNHYPLFVVWCTTLDGGPYAGDVYYGSRSELWYKDA